MEEKVSIIGIIVENVDSTDKLNALLHEYGSYIIGRMGIPYKERGISLISVALDAAPDTISSLTGRLGQISGVSVKAAVSKK